MYDGRTNILKVITGHIDRLLHECGEQLCIESAMHTPQPAFDLGQLRTWGFVPIPAKRFNSKVHPAEACAVERAVKINLSNEFVPALVDRQDLQLEELTVPEPIGL
ncbi:MAG: hypothetical protein ACXVBG_24270, partial [Isosphaeraceae bacterium]